MKEKFFGNIGKKIKDLAFFVFAIGSILCIAAGIIIFATVDSTRWISNNWYIPVLLMVVGPVLMWLGSLFTYGFGELIENSSKLAAGSKEDEDDQLPTI